MTHTDCSTPLDPYRWLREWTRANLGGYSLALANAVSAHQLDTYEEIPQDSSDSGDDEDLDDSNGDSLDDVDLESPDWPSSEEEPDDDDLEPEGYEDSSDGSDGTPTRSTLVEDRQHVFEVHDDLRLELQGAENRILRHDIYSADVEGTLVSPETLLRAAHSLPPLMWEIETMYSTAREDVAAGLRTLQAAITAHQGNAQRDAGQANQERRALQALAARHAEFLEDLPEHPEDGAEDWLLGCDPTYFEESVRPRLREWWNSEPNYTGYEEDFVPDDSHPQGCAFVYFQEQFRGDPSSIGVRVVDGDRPGSNYRAAELRWPIDQANEAALALELPVTFVPAPQAPKPVVVSAPPTSSIAADKQAAYRETHFRVGAPASLTLLIGEANPRLAELMQQHGVDCCAFVTSCNPNGQELDSATNARRLSELRDGLVSRGLEVFEGQGAHPSNGWPPEPSFLVLGLRLDDARALGRRWDQDAVVWAGTDAIPQLVLLI